MDVAGADFLGRMLEPRCGTYLALSDKDGLGC